MDNQTIELLLKYYKDGTLTEFALCSGIQSALAGHIRTNVSITSDTVTQTNSTFVVAIMPIKTEAGYRVEYLIDRKALGADAVSNSDIARCLYSLKEHEVEIISTFQKELAKIKYCDFALSDAIRIYTQMMRLSVAALPYDFKVKAEALELIDVNAIDIAIEKIYNAEEPIERIIEELAVNGILPDAFIKEAKGMVDHRTATRVVIGDSKPSINILQNTFGHSAEDDDIFSGGIQIKENAALNENYALNKKK